MVVDDDALVLKVLVLELHVEFEVIPVNSYGAALAVLDAEGDFVAVVSDLDLGSGASGADLLNEVQRRSPSCARVLVSGSADPLDVAAGTARGLIDRFIPKPFGRNEVLSAVRAALNGKHSA